MYDLIFLVDVCLLLHDVFISLHAVTGCNYYVSFSFYVCYESVGIWQVCTHLCLLLSMRRHMTTGTILTDDITCKMIILTESCLSSNYGPVTDLSS